MTTTQKTILSVFITNLGKYNEGELIGEWLELPATDDEIEAVKARIGINERYEEWFITDYESDYGLTAHEYDNLDELNDQAAQLEALDEWELEILTVLMEEGGYDFEQALEEMDEVQVFWNCDDESDVAYQYLEETGQLDSMGEFLRNYFDFDAFGRDLSYDGHFMFANGNCYVVWR